MAANKLDRTAFSKKTEIPANFAVTVNENTLTTNHGGNPFRDNGRIDTVRVLALTEYIEIP